MSTLCPTLYQVCLRNFSHATLLPVLPGKKGYLHFHRRKLGSERLHLSPEMIQQQVAGLGLAGTCQSLEPRSFLSALRVPRLGVGKQGNPRKAVLRTWVRERWGRGGEGEGRGKGGGERTRFPLGQEELQGGWAGGALPSGEPATNSSRSGPNLKISLDSMTPVKWRSPSSPLPTPASHPLLQARVRKVL